MRILMVASEVPPVRSGVALAVDRIAAGALASGHYVETRSYSDGRVLVRDQIRLATLGLSLRRREMANFDIVHLHGPSPTLSDLLLLRRRVGSVPVPVVYTHHFTVSGDVPSLEVAYRAYDRVVRRLAKAASIVVTTTASYAAMMAEVSGSSPVRVIPWGVDPPDEHVRRSQTDPNEPLRVLVLGQMRRYKGHLVALAAAREVAEIRLTLAGDGPLVSDVVSAAAEDRNVEVAVRPTDAQVEALYRSHDVILLPSTTAAEAFGIVLLEGMMRGCVPVASDLPGVAEVASPTGLLVVPGSSSSLRSALLSLASDRGELHRRANASLKRAALFSWDRTIEQYLAVYEQALRESER